MKVQVKKSVEGGKFKVVILDKELADALVRYNDMNDTLVFLMFNGIIDAKSDVMIDLLKIDAECKVIFRKYDLDKYDVRANYKWNESKIV